MSFILKLIEEGEHLTQDFKLRVDDSGKIAKTIAAFANTSGGRLLIGVKDNGVVAGCNTEEEFHMVEAAAQMYCRPAVSFEVQVWRVEFKKVLEIKIERSNGRPHFVKDEQGEWQAYLRKEDRIHKASPVMVKVWQYQMRHDRTEFRYDINVGKLFSALRDSRELRFVQVARLARLGFEETEDLLSLLIVWSIVKTKPSKKGFLYELADSKAMDKLESEGSQVFKYNQHNIPNFEA
ncbi:MAG TPA: ATP-binding protein [Flavobacteriales bacterium]|nr:ATP-binding protein [Flavobacteriales bacterium]HIB76018.1 ATP-binding protein [Flavobacteriales bacterium]HIO16418.1 ATP-binding protein [Flavobacteriales bacterium]